MSPGGPKIDGGSNGLPVAPYIEDGEILVGKLASTLLGALWLTVVAGWITIVGAITRVHVQALDAAAVMYVRIIRAAGGGGADVLRESWGAAFRAAVEVHPLLAPTIMTGEVMIVWGLLVWARRRWV